MSSTPTLGSILLASTNPQRLRAWYEVAFAVSANPDGFLEFGEVSLIIDGRDDVAARNLEPGRTIINLHVHDARHVADQLDSIGSTWVSPLEYREDGGAWFATVLDPDGNYLQIIELTEAYWVARQNRFAAAGRPDRSPTPSSH
jgi:predicted enzyme related to lactoylglutathione lyase